MYGKIALAHPLAHRYRTMQVSYINKSFLYVSIPNADVTFHKPSMTLEGQAMIGAEQLRGARALLGIDQRELALLSGLSMPTIQRMEASKDIIRGNVDSLMKLIAALDAAGIEFIAPGAASPDGGRGVRLARAGQVVGAG